MHQNCSVYHEAKNRYFGSGGGGALYLSVLDAHYVGLRLTLSVDVVSFMWVATGAYAEHINAGIPGYPQFLNSAFQPHSCGH